MVVSMNLIKPVNPRTRPYHSRSGCVHFFARRAGQMSPSRRERTRFSRAPFVAPSVVFADLLTCSSSNSRQAVHSIEALMLARRPGCAIVVAYVA
jgi:hypothetical protein